MFFPLLHRVCPCAHGLHHVQFVWHPDDDWLDDYDCTSYTTPYSTTHPDSYPRSDGTTGVDSYAPADPTPHLATIESADAQPYAQSHVEAHDRVDTHAIG